MFVFTGIKQKQKEKQNKKNVLAKSKTCKSAVDFYFSINLNNCKQF